MRQVKDLIPEGAFLLEVRLKGQAEPIGVLAQINDIERLDALVKVAAMAVKEQL